VDVSPSRVAEVGGQKVQRALPQHGRRTIGAWCFADHFGPTAVTEREGVNVGPHPHMGLHTVTWLVSGELLHRDSLGSEQPIRPGELNLMTAGGGISHSEEATGAFRGELHGIQLWVAQPDATRHGAPAFEHHGSLPGVDLGNGTATVLVGDLDGVTSAARRDSALMGADIELRGGTTVVPVDAAFEHGLVLLAGAVSVEGCELVPGQLGYVGPGPDELAITAAAPARVVLVGGVPFPEPVTMFWNFVGRSRDELAEAGRSWNADDGRFGAVVSPLERIPSPPPWWRQD
jgi:redox-sensitive bicupin YhaK (pirin superfamily)